MATAVSFTEADLRQAAGERSFGRGLGYLTAVGDLEIGPDEVTATVYGTDDYAVVLDLAGGGLSGGCSCPYGQDGFFCKHLVAVGLTVLRLGEALPARRAAAAAKAGALDAWLAGLSREDLLAVVRDQIAEDPGFRHRLELRAAASGPDPGAIGDRVAELLDASRTSRYGYLEYDDAHAYAGQVGEVAEVLGGLIDGGHAAAAAGAARQALGTVVAALAMADDSSGSIGASAAELIGVHARACAAAQADPVELGGWLARFALGDGQTLGGFDAGAYSEALGERGAAEYRRLITAAWQGNPSGFYEKYLMEEVLRAAGDVDALIASYAADLLPSGYTHLRIAQELDAAGRPGDALAWAERGMREAAGAADSRLVDYLAARYAAAGALSRALALRNHAFDADRSLASYRALREAARAAGHWEEVREVALARLRADATGPRDRARAWWYRDGGPVWVSALIDDGDIAAAWDAAAVAASDGQWLTLADLVSEDRPADALAVYLRAIEPLRSTTGDAAYQQAAALLAKIQDCHRRLGTMPEFTAYLAWLRADQKRKRNLIKLLDQRGLRP